VLVTFIAIYGDSGAPRLSLTVSGGAKKRQSLKKKQTQVKKFSHETRIYVEHENRKPIFTTDSKMIFGENLPTLKVPDLINNIS
jgi:hypothetical protein